MEVNKETVNVQQAESLTGQVGSQAVAVQDIVDEAVNEPSKEEVKVAERRKALSETLITLDTVVEPLRYSLSVDGVGVFSLLDIHGVKAKQKAGKTTMLKVCAAAWLRGEQFRVKSELEAPRVLWLDTEQNRPDVKQILTDIVEMTGVDADYITSHLHVHALRCCSYEGLYDLMVQAVIDFKPQVVIVDGIVEFVASFNDEAIAKKLMHDLQVMSQEHECAVVCVLHTNKADEDHNMRGHLGTMLAQKAGTVVECKKQGGIISVTCSESRHQEMPEWSIMFDDEGHIVDADEQRKQFIEQRKAEQQQKRREETERKQKERLDYALKCIDDYGGSINKKQLIEIMMKKFELKRPSISNHLSMWINDHRIYDVNGMIQITPDNVIPF
jgi:plasmid maintenance system killer protein